MTNKMNTKDRFKKFVSDNEAILVGTAIIATSAAAVVGTFTVIGKVLVDTNTKSYANKLNDYNDWAGVENEWLSDVEAQDKGVWLLADHTYLLIPKDTETEWIKDRPKNPLHK